MNTRKLYINILNTIFALSVVFFLGSYTMAWASTEYYIDTNNSQASDSNPGSKVSPWKTIGKASTTMVAGDTAMVVAGTYSERVSSTRSGTSGNPITFKASGVVNILGGDIKNDYITIDGFAIKNNGEIDITIGNYCKVLNNDFNPGYVTMHYQNTPESPTGCLIKGNRFHSIKNPDGDYIAVQIFGSHHIIENNEIGPSSDIDAFRLWGHDHTIRNNYIHDISYSPNSQAHMDGFQIFGDNGWASYNHIIENNRFINFQGQLFMTSTDGVTGIHDIILRNNVFAHFGQNANIGIKNMSFFNNTFYDTGIFGGIETGFGTSTGAVFKNNLFIKINGYNLTGYDANLFLHSVPWTMENNFFSTISGASLNNFDNQKGGINGGIINFANVAANDFSIKSGSVVIDKGANLTGFSYDLVGTARPQGAAFDIGAYEYSAGPATVVLPPTNVTVH